MTQDIAEMFTSIRDELLPYARTVLEAWVREHTRIEAKKGGIWDAYIGVFSTLTLHGMLRGCIGYPIAQYPLGVGLREAVIASAEHDPRFPPVEPEELKDIVIEISLLTPLKKIQSLDEIEVGRHGLVVEKGPYRGLLLPKVPVEYGWDKETFLQHTCLKAGLPGDAWKDPALQFYIFETYTVKEDEDA